MGRIYYLLGKSATGKDTLYKEILKRRPKLRTVTMYTTRPIREGETDGVEYFFVDQERFDEMMDEEKIIEFRSPVRGLTIRWMTGSLMLPTTSPVL